MTSLDSYDDDLDEFDGDDEGFDEADWSDDDVDLVECPSCQTMIYEDSEQCPNCHEYITHSASAWSGRPWWWYVLAISGVIAVVYMFVL